MGNSDQGKGKQNTTGRREFGRGPADPSDGMPSELDAPGKPASRQQRGARPDEDEDLDELDEGDGEDLELEDEDEDEDEDDDLDEDEELEGADTSGDTDDDMDGGSGKQRR
jgi:hypothetical protein